MVATFSDMLKKAKTGKEWAWFFYQELGFRIADDEEDEQLLKKAMDKVFEDVESLQNTLHERAIRLLLFRAGGRLNMFEAGMLYHICLLLGLKESRKGKIGEQEKHWQSLVLSCRTEAEAEKKLKAVLGLGKPKPEAKTK